MANKAIRFYPMKWLHNPALRLCSSGARGLWIDLLCLMFPAGILDYKNLQEISALTGVSCDLVELYISELAEKSLITCYDGYIIESSIMQRAYKHSQNSAEHAKKSMRWEKVAHTDKPDAKKNPARIDQVNWWDTPSGWAKEAQKQSLCRNPGESLYDFQVRASIRIGHGEYRNHLSPAQLMQIEAMTPKQ